MPESPDKPCPHCGALNEIERETCWACYKLLSGDDRQAPKVEATGAIPEAARDMNPGAPSSVSVFGISLSAGDPSDPGSFWWPAALFLVLISVLGWTLCVKAKLHLDGRITTGTFERVGFGGRHVVFNMRYYYRYTVPGGWRLGRANSGSVLGSLTPGTTFPVLYSPSDPDISEPVGESWLGFLTWWAFFLGLAVVMFRLALVARRAAFDFW